MTPRDPASDPIRVIDFAPTATLSGFIKELIAESPLKFSYRTADLFLEGVDDRVDITDMPLYHDDSVDFFVCSHMLEHVGDDRKAMRELYRILKPGGQGILVVPIVLTLKEIDEDPSVTDPAERWRRFGQDDHVRLYSKEGFLQRVAEAGFKVSELGQDHFGRETFRRYGIGERSILYIVSKDD
jgi:SAM-dependent methyltransferase